MNITTLITLHCIVAFSAAQAGTLVAPGNFATNAGPTGLNTLLRGSGFPRTYQMQFAPAALGGLPAGARIKELRFRLHGDTNPTNFPAADITWPDYEVTLAQAANPVSAMSTNFAANMLRPVVVKDGALLLRANSFTLSAGTNSPFGSLIVFDTRYIYQGGDLVMLFRHPGSDSTSAAFLDAVDGTTSGYGTAFRALSATSFNAANGSDSSILTIAQIVFEYPGTVVAPSDFTTNAGTTGVNTLLRGSGSPRTYQMQFTPAALGGLPIGARIKELRFRLHGDTNPTNFPAADITWPDYEVTLAQAANPVSAMSTNFAANMLRPVVVKDGALLLRANSFTLSAGTNNPFGSLVVFDTPYIYQGGDLVMLFSHPGSDSTSTAYLDAVQSSTPGYGTAFRALSAYSFNAASGSAASAAIAQIVYQGTVLNLEARPDVVRDSKPSGTPHHGINRGAAWLASSTDTSAAPVTRQGVMRFTSTERDQIVVPWDADFNTTWGAVTFWIRSAGITYGGNEGAMIIDHRHPVGDVIVQDDTGVIFWQPNGLYNAHGTRTVSDGNWHHVAYVFDQAPGATVSVYIDGLLDTVAPVNFAAWSWSELQIEIGLSWDPWWRVFNGELDDIRFYKRQLSLTEVQQIYAGDPTPVGALDLAGRYNFDGPPGLRLILTWPLGALESAPSVAGPWSTVPAAVSPYEVLDSAGSTFYRLKL